MSETKDKKAPGKTVANAGSVTDDLKKIATEFLSGAAKYSEVSKGIFYIAGDKEKKNTLKFLAGYACTEPANGETEIAFGDGFPGQVALDRRVIRISDIPEGYMTIESGLGKGRPVSIIVLPVALNGKTLGVAELASFKRFSRDDEAFFLDLATSAAKEIVSVTGKNK